MLREHPVTVVYGKVQADREILVPDEAAARAWTALICSESGADPDDYPVVGGYTIKILDFHKRSLLNVWQTLDAAGLSADSVLLDYPRSTVRVRCALDEIPAWAEAARQAQASAHTRTVRVALEVIL